MSSAGPPYTSRKPDLYGMTSCATSLLYSIAHCSRIFEEVVWELGCDDGVPMAAQVIRCLGYAPGIAFCFHHFYKDLITFQILLQFMQPCAIVKPAAKFKVF